MYDPDKLVRRRRDGNPNGFDPVLDTYEFEPNARNGQVKKVVVVHQRGHGYRTIVFIDGKEPMERSYHEGQWGMAKDDLDEALRQYQCDPFTIKEPRQS
jgi:hypothetical protein